MSTFPCRIGVVRNAFIMTKANVAIILAASEYDNLNPLPACRKDADVMRSIIDSPGKFRPEHILCIDTETTSSTVKAAVSKFLSSLEGTVVGELFFYYSGHGMFEGEFHFLFTDYDETRKRQTTLSNTELDAMLKGQDPELAIKVVDACQCGQNYVKSRESFGKALQETQARFNSRYFMFSSDQQQSSFASNVISDLTHQFALSVMS